MPAMNINETRASKRNPIFHLNNYDSQFEQSIMSLRIRTSPAMSLGYFKGRFGSSLDIPVCLDTFQLSAGLLHSDMPDYCILTLFT